MHIVLQCKGLHVVTIGLNVYKYTPEDSIFHGHVNTS